MSHGWEFAEQGGAELFRNICAGCHQPDAKGAVGAGSYPSLVADKNLDSADFMLSVLLGGLRGMVDSDAKCNPVDSIGSSTESRVSHSERGPSARFPGDKDGSARREIEPLP
jgi:Cytochrome c